MIKRRAGKYPPERQRVVRRTESESRFEFYRWEISIAGKEIRIDDVW